MMLQQNVPFLRACASAFRRPSSQAMEIEAAGFVARDASPECDRFGLLAIALDAAVERDREGLAAIEAIEASSGRNGRSHGLEWAAEQLWTDATRLRQAADLLRALAGREAEVRALLASPAREA